MIRPRDKSYEDLLRELAPQVLGVVARRFRDFATAEDAAQEAIPAAFIQWPHEDTPVTPRAWLIRVASRRVKDRRSEIARPVRREAEVAGDSEVFVPGEMETDMDPDDTLVLLFMCCHPALTPYFASLLRFEP